MNWLAVLSLLKGYRTHLAVAITVLTALSTASGLLPTTAGHSLSIAFAGLAMTFSRFATSDLSKKIDDLLNSTGTPPSTDPPANVGWASFHQQLAEAVADEVLADQHRTLPFNISGKAGMIAVLFWCLCHNGHAQDRPTILTSMQLSPETRGWFKNPDGSCVQCSIGMAGVHCNDPNAASLLWDTSYGKAVRGGSWPSRFEQYCDQRGIKAWSVTAQSVDETLPWMTWAAKTGRFAAIGAGTAHFQTLYGYDPSDAKPWMVCNNNSTQRIDRYTDTEFRRLHQASGPWVVILQRASSDPPQLQKWWR